MTVSKTMGDFFPEQVDSAALIHFSSKKWLVSWTFVFSNDEVSKFAICWSTAAADGVLETNFLFLYCKCLLVIFDNLDEKSSSCLTEPDPLFPSAWT